MRSPVQFYIPPKYNRNLRTSKERPLLCDHKITFAKPLWIQCDLGDFLFQTFDGGDYCIELRSLMIKQHGYLDIFVRRHCIVIAILLEGILEGNLPGKIIFKLDAKTYAIFYLPGGIHRLNLCSGKHRWFCLVPPLQYLKNMAVEEAGMREIMLKIAAKEDLGSFLPVLPLPVKLQRILKRMVQTTNKGAALDFELRRYILEILGLYSEQVKTYAESKVSYPTTIEKAIAIREYILAHLGDMNLGGLNEMALRFHISTKPLTKAFRKLTGKTVPQFIGDERLDWAKRLLEKKEMHVFEIAWITGFSDTANFNRKFKKKFGYPPLNRRGTYARNTS